MLILATLSAIAAFPVFASVALATTPTVLHTNDKPTAECHGPRQPEGRILITRCHHMTTSRTLAVVPPIAFARSDFVRAPRNETIYIPQELDFFVEPGHGT